jgi:hypothetical protein
MREVVTPRPSAVVTCEWCRWTAQHTADTVLEIAAFLRQLLLTHCRQVHPDKLFGPEVLEP